MLRMQSATFVILSTDDLIRILSSRRFSSKCIPMKFDVKEFFMDAQHHMGVSD